MGGDSRAEVPALREPLSGADLRLQPALRVAWGSKEALTRQAPRICGHDPEAGTEPGLPSQAKAAFLGTGQSLDSVTQQRPRPHPKLRGNPTCPQPRSTEKEKEETQTY